MPAVALKRLKGAARFRRVYVQGIFLRGRGVDVGIVSSLEEAPAMRLGISIRRSAIKTSVGRNRWKRWIREVFRRNPERVLAGHDVIVRVHHPLKHPCYREAERAILAQMAAARQAPRVAESSRE